MATITKTIEVPLEREKLHLLLLENPNYFGTLHPTDPVAIKFKPVLPKSGDTTYEQITCVGYDPDLQELAGIVKIKLNSGYSGGPCTAGSKEYVRFFVDYGFGWQDLGVQSFDVHDITHTYENPLDYAVNLHFVPKRRHCCFEEPILPKVRAILSWNLLPPAGNPHWTPVWGNALDVHIQISPSSLIGCLLKKGLADIGVTLTKEKEAALSAVLPDAVVNGDALKQSFSTQNEEVSLAHLVKIYGKEVEPERIGFTSIVKALSLGTADTVVHDEFTAVGLDIAKIIAGIIKPKYTTTYEEVKCVGLNRDTSILNATINLKKTLGYAGGLCTKGSREYVAFYMDFGSGWVYMGTSSVRVHDVKHLPGGVLSYNVELPVNLQPYQKPYCKEVYLAKVRAILSWNQLPPVNPNWIPVWGNMIESWVEIRNGLISTPGDRQPYILSISTLPATKVNTSTGLVDQTWGSADPDVDKFNGYSFNGAIAITGIITTPPDSNDNPGSQMQYRIMLKKASQPDSAFAPVTNTFQVLKTVISGGVPVSTIVPQVNSLGYYNYLVDYTPSTIVSVYGDLLGELLLPDSDLYQFYIETDAGFRTITYAVKTDTDVPDNVHIHIDGGQDCGTLKQGNPVTGTYSIADIENNCLGVSFEIIYYPPGTSSVLTVDGVGQGWYGAIVPVPPIGKNGVWSITTDHLTPCGYNLRMYAFDKTIVCQHTLPYAYYIYTQYTYDTLGFCLAKP